MLTAPPPLLSLVSAAAGQRPAGDAIEPRRRVPYRSLERLDTLNARITKEDEANASLGASHLCHAAFAHIDRLANKQMKDMRKVYNVIFGLAAIMATVGNRVPGDGEHWVITSLSLSLLLLVLLSVALSRVHSSRANRNATELRALAEGLRVQNVWRQAGIARAVSLHYLRRSHDNIARVRRAMLAAVFTRKARPAR